MARIDFIWTYWKFADIFRYENGICLLYFYKSNASLWEWRKNWHFESIFETQLSGNGRHGGATDNNSRNTTFTRKWKPLFNSFHSNLLKISMHLCTKISPCMCKKILSETILTHCFIIAYITNSTILTHFKLVWSRLEIWFW